MNRRVRGLSVFFLALGLVGPAWAQQARREEGEDPFRRWLEEEVVYIISEQEREVFQALRTEEEKLAFIEQFWKSRDPDPATAENEFREEHYRRLAYVNEHFSSGKPGWKTDRGWVYIRFGPPDRRFTNPTGGRLFRTRFEAANSDRMYSPTEMTALPYEVWEYRYLPGVGQEVAFEFVARDGSTDYVLALSEEDKDALFYETGSHIPAYRKAGNFQAFDKRALSRLETLAAAQRAAAPGERTTHVSTRVQFSDFPFQVSYALSESSGEEAASHCHLRVQLPNSSLTFERRGDRYVAELEAEVEVTDVRRVRVAHIRESLGTTFPVQDLKESVKKTSVWERSLRLAPGRYVVDVTLHDLLGGIRGFQRVLVIVPGRE